MAKWWALPLGYIAYILFFIGIDYDAEKFLYLANIGMFFLVFYKLDKISKDTSDKKMTETVLSILIGALFAYLTNRYPFY